MNIRDALLTTMKKSHRSFNIVIFGLENRFQFQCVIGLSRNIPIGIKCRLPVEKFMRRFCRVYNNDRSPRQVQIYYVRIWE